MQHPLFAGSLLPVQLKTLHRSRLKPRGLPFWKCGLRERRVSAGIAEMEANFDRPANAMLSFQPCFCIQTGSSISKFYVHEILAEYTIDIISISGNCKSQLKTEITCTQFETIRKQHGTV